MTKTLWTRIKRHPIGPVAMAIMGGLLVGSGAENLSLAPTGTLQASSVQTLGLNELDASPEMTRAATEKRPGLSKTAGTEAVAASALERMYQLELEIERERVALMEKENQLAELQNAHVLSLIEPTETIRDTQPRG